jgi:hypothetical protein
MRLISWTLQSGSKQFIYNLFITGKLERRTWIWIKELEAAQRNGQEEPWKKRDIYREGI